MQLISLSDLENDFINPYDLSSRLNRFVVSFVCAAGSQPHTRTSGSEPAHRATTYRCDVLCYPHTVQILEYVAQCVIVVTLLLSGKWFCGALHVCMLAYMLHSLVKRQHVVDATDVFKQLPAQKKKRYIMFGFFLATLVIVMYR
jgi:hypothetical protein